MQYIIDFLAGFVRKLTESYIFLGFFLLSMLIDVAIYIVNWAIPTLELPNLQALVNMMPPGAHWALNYVHFDLMLAIIGTAFIVRLVIKLIPTIG